MRTFLIIFSLFVSTVMFGQASTNPFAGENTNTTSGNRYSSPQGLKPSDDKIQALGRPENPGENPPGGGKGRGGNPAKPLPIDDYIPVFLVVAVAIIVYKGRTLSKLQA